jgi:hypothetical protein
VVLYWYWLPIAQRVKYKVLTLTHKTLHNRAPIYLKQLVQPHTGIRNTRSALKLTLTVKQTRTSYGDRSFAAAASAATLWNFLPLELANTIDFVPYRRALKTFVFNEHYGTAL